MFKIFFDWSLLSFMWCHWIDHLKWLDSMTNKTCMQLYQVVGEAKSGDVVGEIGVLCYRPQLFTVRTKRLSQILRLSRTSFLNLSHSNVEDGTMIMNNFLQVYIKLWDLLIFSINYSAFFSFVFTLIYLKNNLFFFFP